MGLFRFKGILLALLLVSLLLCLRFEATDAKRGRHWRPRRSVPNTSSLTKKKVKVGNRHHRSQHSGGGGDRRSSPSPSPNSNRKPNPSPSPSTPSSNPNPSSSIPTPAPNPSPTPFPSPITPTPTTNPSPSPIPNISPSIPSPNPGKGNLPSQHAVVFNVLNFGAKGDGVVDDTKAFQGAWAEACKVEASTVLVPWGYEFLVGPISFSGPYCQPNIVFQLDGMIIAPKSPKAWGAGLLQWLEFTKLRGITIQGRGVIEGQGSVWWTYSQSGEEPISADLNGNMPSIKPTALRFYGSYNVTVTGITIQNSPQCHLKFDNCEAVMVFNMTISSPGDSLNTDGIHLQNSQSVSIHHVNVACGDDCVSIQTGCSDVKIHSIHCGPGHGISIGGLGRDNTKACVSNITVQDVDIHNTMTGVRIKTWQGGSGSVQGIKFSNIRMYEVQTPIVIDQFYCDRSTCKNQTSAVALTSISYESIIGTYTVEPVRFACSDFTPCSDISLTEVELKPVQEQYHMYEPFCWQAFGELYTPTVPPIFCLQNGKPLSNRVLADHDTC